MSGNVQDAEKAFDVWVSSVHPLYGDPRGAVHQGFMAGRASRDAEAAALEDAVIANERASEAAEAGEEVAIGRAIRAERTLAEAQATIEKALAVVNESDQGDSFMPVYEALSAPSSTGGNDHE